jgi:acetyltransferase-like isoleucine patch superfamily enzyme
MNRDLLIIGAGQYGMVAKEIAESMRCFDKIDFLDDNSPLAIGKVSEYKCFLEKYHCAFVAIGNSNVRLGFLRDLEEAGYHISTLISPLASVSPTARIMQGSIVEPMAVVQAFSDVGVGCLVCAGAVIKHNAIVEDGCYIDCNAVVMPDTVVQTGTKVSANSVLALQINI